MYAFDYCRPSSLAAAVEALADAPDVKVLAGGQTLIPTMKNRLARPAMLVDLGAVDDLQLITRDTAELRIGAMATHAAVAASPVVIDALPGLARLAAGIGDPLVRHRGTIGGSVANNDPAADYPAALLSLGAIVETNRRSIGSDEFFKGLFTTVLDEGEIIVAVRFPLPATFAYAKFPNPASRYAMVGVAVARRGGAVRVAVTGAGQSGVFRHSALEGALARSFTPAATAAAVPRGFV